MMVLGMTVRMDMMRMLRSRMRKYWACETTNGDGDDGDETVEHDDKANYDENDNRVVVMRWEWEWWWWYWSGEATDGEGELYPQCDQLPGDPGGQVLFLIGWICFKYLRTNKCLEIFQTVTVYITIPDCQETFRIVWELSTLYKHCLDCLSWYSRNFQDCLDCLTTFQIVKKLSGKSENFQDCPESKSTQMHYYPPQKWLPSLSSERRATWTVLQGLTWWSWPLKCLRASETRCCPSQRHGFKF